MILVCLVFSVLYINVFVPFNINRWFSDSGFIQFLRLSSYGLVVSLVLLFTQFPLRKLFKVKAFSIKSYALWLLIEILLISLVYIFLYGNPVGNFSNDFIFSLKYTLLGILLPYLFSLFIIYYKNQRAEIRTLKDQLGSPVKKEMLVFKDEYDRIKFSLRTQDVLFLESTDNYITVYYLAEEKIQRKLLRNSLKRVEEMLAKNRIVRCHRSFIVNWNQIEMVQLNGKRLQLKLSHYDKIIPVSEKYSPLFLDLLSQQEVI
ncbi:LytTR family DNA-binding domain-containing protein [uncultured Sunxiuqinia sp.]|uniref:LytR/AlgR family response regulator transcription factor n=1 Tax=uncultured Sunxiuqinia sp. TaxID=1573825 RepID=UPI0026075E49|nr:LytTR family DNA-binding domain-containing protein [uncultured Sunxiuqinia sp.]